VNIRKELESYDYINIRLINDKFSRKFLLNKKLKVYNVLVNMNKSATTLNTDNECKFFYVCEEDVLKIRDDEDTIVYYLYAEDCIFDRKEKIERLLEK